MYTKEQLQGMSDFEVNKALCTLLGKDVSGVDEQRNMMTGAVTDYCNNPNDIMPLAFEHELALQRVTQGACGYWVAGPNTFHHVADTNPLRAIACCLILVLQGREA